MDKKEMLEELNMNAMRIILHAGDAKLLIEEAVDLIKNKNLKEFNEKMNEANLKIVEAHKIQTATIQKQIELEENVYSILFSHAQDTIMTIKSEYETTLKIVKLIF